MKFEILDVGHGFCAYVVADNGNLMMFDCGHNGDTGFRPSEYLYRLGHRTIHRLLIANYDEDHISDLPNLRNRFSIPILHRNKTLSQPQLRALKLKSGPLSEAMREILDMMGTYTTEVTSPPVFPNIVWHSFYHSYPQVFEDTNNLSLVTFIDLNNVRFVLPGDLEKPGWEYFLHNRNFVELLKGASVFVASHHGRESGYCSNVFSYCYPDVVIISDSQKEYATQEMVNTYANHARGISFNGKTRYVLTTRTDGALTWQF